MPVAHKLGDRWPGIASIGPILINGATPANALTRIKMQFKKEAIVFKLDSDSSAAPQAPIVISDSAAWSANVPEIETFVNSSGKWQWDMEFYESGKTQPLTLYKGTLTVVKDITK